MPLPSIGKVINTAPRYQVRMYSPMSGSVLRSAPRALKTGPISRQPPADMIAVTAKVSMVPWVASRAASSLNLGFRGGDHRYLSTLVTTPEPTVRPPSRMANRKFSCMATGAISVTLILTFSPGKHISAPPSRLISPVTSVVRK